MVDLTNKNVVYYGYTGGIDSDGVTRICQALNVAANNGVDYIYLCFSSLGGYVADGIYLYNHVRGLHVPVIMHATGTVASIATAIFVAAHNRYCATNAIFMMHPTTVGPFAEGVAAARMQSALNSVIADDDRTEAILRKRTKLSDDILKARRLREVYLTPKDALDFGLVEEVVDFQAPSGCTLVQL